MADFPFIFINQKLIFEEVTTLPYYLVKQPLGALCAQREETSGSFTELYAKGMPSTGQAGKQGRRITKCLRKKKLGKVSMVGPSKWTARLQVSGHLITPSLLLVRECWL